MLNYLNIFVKVYLKLNYIYLGNYNELLNVFLHLRKCVKIDPKITL